MPVKTYFTREKIETEIKIGFQFYSRGNRNDINTINDIYTTYNNNKEIVKKEYYCSHLFMGQTVNHLENETSILLSVWSKGFVNKPNN